MGYSIINPAIGVCPILETLIMNHYLPFLIIINHHSTSIDSPIDGTSHIDVFMTNHQKNFILLYKPLGYDNLIFSPQRIGPRTLWPATSICSPRCDYWGVTISDKPFGPCRGHGGSGTGLVPWGTGKLRANHQVPMVGQFICHSKLNDLMICWTRSHFLDKLKWEFKHQKWCRNGDLMEHNWTNMLI